MSNLFDAFHHVSRQWELNHHPDDRHHVSNIYKIHQRFRHLKCIKKGKMLRVFKMSHSDIYATVSNWVNLDSER